MNNIPINYLAVLVAGLANMVVGFIWYGPLFGGLWKNLMGFTDESMKNMKLSMMQAMGLGFVTALVMACVLGRFAYIAGAMDVAGALKVAFYIWLGFLATTSASTFIWEGKPFKLFLLNATEQLVSISIMAIILVLWQ